MTNTLEIAAHVARRSGGKPAARRNYTRDLRTLAAKGWVVVASLLPYEGQPVDYAPRFKTDPAPWTRTDAHGCVWRFSGRECHTVRACGVPFFGGRKCGLPTGHDKACRPRT